MWQDIAENIIGLGVPYWRYLGMAIALNHTIVHARDKSVSAQFLASLFDLPAPKPFGPFSMST
jgi:hypothetical protein